MSPQSPADKAKNLIKIPEMRRIKHIHFVGIGGAGMCGIAEVLRIRAIKFLAQILKHRKLLHSSKRMALKFILVIMLIIFWVQMF